MSIICYFWAENLWDNTERKQPCDRSDENLSIQRFAALLLNFSGTSTRLVEIYAQEDCRKTHCSIGRIDPFLYKMLYLYQTQHTQRRCNTLLNTEALHIQHPSAQSSQAVVPTGHATA
jgi:hypothetical protein